MFTMNTALQTQFETVTTVTVTVMKPPSLKISYMFLQANPTLI